MANNDFLLKVLEKFYHNFHFLKNLVNEKDPEPCRLGVKNIFYVIWK